jgi:hypothetical protein
MKIYYIYYHKDPESKEIKYIGKGCGRRAFDFKKRGPRHLHWIRELKRNNLLPLVEIVEYFDDEKIALKREEELIKMYKSNGIRLMNISENGTGLSGTLNGAYGLERKDLSERNRKNKGKSIEEIYGNEKAEEIRKNLKIRYSGSNNPMYGRSGKNAPCFGRIGELHPMYGKNHAEKSKAKISASLILNRGTKIFCSNGITYSSISKAAKELKMSTLYIREILKGTRESHKSYIFQYVK